MSILRRRHVAVATMVALVLGGCSDGGGSSSNASTTSTAPAATTTPAVSSTNAVATGATTTNPTGSTPNATTTIVVPPPPSAATVRAAKLKLTKLATANAPLVLVPRPDSGLLYVAERAGRVRTMSADGTLGDVLVDISSDVTTDFEKGLLGLTFSPDSRFLYLSYTDADSNSRIDEFRMSGDGVAAGSRRAVIEVDQPAGNHNGGNIAFGPDGYLWFGLGDGGGSGDRYGNGQNLNTLLGSVLRIDPFGRGAGEYSIPADNPFAAGGGRPEIWLYGVRNPWRWSFDRLTGDLWIGDVGQNAYEEIDLLAAPARGRGANLQWPLREGLHKFNGDAPAGSTPPVFEYDRSNGSCSVVGGFVYRGRAIASLVGAYIYGDYCEGTLFALIPKSGGYERVSLNVDAGKGALVSFGQDADGELFTLALGGTISKLTPA